MPADDHQILHLHNTLTGIKESFAPLDPTHVRLYVCGPTVYARAHIGNARPVVVFDVLQRLLKRLYPRVTYVRNITDVDDKIMRAAAEQDVPIEVITTAATAFYHADMDALGAERPTHEPRATAYIPEMITMIERLIAAGHAYVREAHVLFDVATWTQYGALSKMPLDARIAGARVDVAPYKKNPEDFVLWKPSSPEVVGWESPWGRGRPGWHIECSAMSEALLGTTFDIHGGGLDLVFPHHENEMAQSRCAHGGSPQANYWVHNGHVIVEGQKMSKSLGNFLTLPDILADAPGEAARYTLLQAHYRQPLDWTRAGLRQAKQSLDRLYGALQTADIQGGTEGKVPDDVMTALLDDLNIPLALAALHQLANAVFKAETPAEQQDLGMQLWQGGRLLGLFRHTPADWFQGMGAPTDLSPDRIEELIQERNNARAARDFTRADGVRAELLKYNIILEDGPHGTTWRKQ